MNIAELESRLVKAEADLKKADTDEIDLYGRPINVAENADEIFDKAAEAVEAAEAALKAAKGINSDTQWYEVAVM